MRLHKKTFKVDLFDRIRTNEESLSKMARQLHGYFTYPKLEGPLGAHMKFRGKDILNWNVNDYLGFTQNEEIRRIDEELTRKWGLSYPSGNRIMAGHTSIHEKLESMLADFTHKEDAFVLNYGYQGISSVIDALCDRKDIIVYDVQVHASMIDGVRLHRGEHFSYQHNDMDSLEKALQKAESKLEKDPQGGILLLTQGVFSSTGDYGKLDQIVALKERYSFRIFLNDADGFGVQGKNGSGTAEHFGVSSQIDLYLGSFSKAFASQGCFISGPELIMNYLRYRTRTQLHSKTLPLVFTEGIIERLKYLKKNLSLLKKLHSNADYLRNALLEKGFDLGESNTNIIPIYFPCNIYEALNIVIDLRENYNIFCPVLIYPFILKDQLLLRLMPTVYHSMEDMDFTLNAFVDIRENLKAQKYSTERSDFFKDS